MKTSHEAQVEIRELLPTILDINQKLEQLYADTVGLIGPQAISVEPRSDISSAFQYLCGSRTLVKEIAGHFGLPLPDRSDPAVAKFKALVGDLTMLAKEPNMLTAAGRLVVQEILEKIRK